MTMTVVIWAAAGLAAGTLHALFLWRATHRRPQALAMVLRLTAVAGLLLAAAVFGRILPMASGWACGFPMTAGALYFRRRS